MTLSTPSANALGEYVGRARDTAGRIWLVYIGEPEEELNVMVPITAVRADKTAERIAGRFWLVSYVLTAGDCADRELIARLRTLLERVARGLYAAEGIPEVDGFEVFEPSRMVH